METCVAALRQNGDGLGCPANINCENGTNFLGISAEIESLEAILRKEPADSSQVGATNLETKMNFLPQVCPVLEVSWKRQKRSKHHLCRVNGNNEISFEKFTTLFFLFKCVLNLTPNEFFRVPKDRQ